jgi:hypothetical protein
MEYFRMSQEKTMLDAVQPTGTSNQTWREPFQRLTPRQLDDQPLQFYIKEQAHPQYIDFIEHPLPLVTDKVKSLLEKYQPNSFFKPVILADLRRMRQEVYWLMIPPSISCLAAESVFNADGTLEQMVLDSGKIGRMRVFSIKGIMENYIIVRLDVAESLLRRDAAGITFTKATCV